MTVTGKNVAENVFGTMGAIFWSIQIVPQIWKSWREGSTDGLSEWLMFLWACSTAFLGVFAIVKGFNIPLIIQPHALGFLSAVSWAQCQFYRRKWSARFSILVFLLFIGTLTGFEVGMVFVLQKSFRRGNEKPVQAFGIISSVLLSSGFPPQYYEIWKYKEVKGISIAFMTVDLLGGVFSDLSLIFRTPFDKVAACAYTLVAVLDGLVILAALILNPKARAREGREIARETTTPRDEEHSNAREGTFGPVMVPQTSAPSTRGRPHPHRMVPRLS